MKKKLLAMSFLTVAMCASLIVGATFALFTSESNVNVAVTSGKVKVTATISDTTTYSMGEETETQGTFANGGTAKVEGSSIVLDRMTPGDKLVVKVSINNESNVAYAQRISLNAAGEDEDIALQAQLLVGVSDAVTEEPTEYKYYSNFVTAWSKTEAASQTRYISIELPEYVGNSAQDMSCAFNLKVEAVQGNADITAAGTARPVHFVESQEALSETLNSVQDGDKIVLGGAAATWENANINISFTDTKTLYFSGYRVDTMTVDAQYGTVYVFNDANSIVGAQVAADSLHIYGSVKTLTVNSGRAVVEKGAVVQMVEAVPSADSNAKVEFAPSATVEAVTVNTSASGSSTNLTIGENVTVPSLTVEGSGEVALENSGTIENTTVDENVTLSGVATDEASLLAALKMDGANVVLANDITVEKATPIVPEGVTVTIDLGGYTLTSKKNSGIVNYGTITSLTNGDIVGGKAYGVVTYGKIGTLNVNVRTGTEGFGPIYVCNGGVIDEIAGGNYIGHGEYLEGTIVGNCGLYISSTGLVKEISGGYFQGTSVAFRSYNKNGIELISGGSFDCGYIDPNGRSFFDNTTIDELFYNYRPLQVTGGKFYNAGTQLNASIPEGHSITQGDKCETTSNKKYVKYDPETETPRHWEDDPAGTVYYYYTVKSNEPVTTP